jgi:hypothetical protein
MVWPEVTAAEAKAGKASLSAFSTAVRARGSRVSNSRSLAAR